MFRWQPMEESEWVCCLSYITPELRACRRLCRVRPPSASVSQTEEVEGAQHCQCQESRDQDQGMTVRGWSPECDTHIRSSDQETPSCPGCLWHGVTLTECCEISSLLQSAACCPASAADAAGKVWSMFVKVRIPLDQWLLRWWWCS